MRRLSYSDYNIFLLMIPSIFTFFYPGKIVIVTALCFYPILFFLFKQNSTFLNDQLVSRNVVVFYFLVNVYIFTRGVFTLSSSEDIIFMFGNTVFITLMFPMYIIYFREGMFFFVVRSILMVGLPLFFLTYFISPSDPFMSFQHNISIFYFFLFFIPFVKLKWKILILVVCASGLFYDLSRRSFLINFIASSFFLISYYLLSPQLFRSFSKTVFYILVISPVVFLVLGLSGVFNVFLIGESFDGIKLEGASRSRNLLVDSRSSIYTDVFRELDDQQSFGFGLGGNGKTRTFLTDAGYGNFQEVYSEGRRGTESGMLNYFQFGGIIAAFSYWLLLTVGAYNAIYKSNSDFVRLLGLFIAFKVLYSFVEDRIYINIATFFLMFLIGLCYNRIVLSYNNYYIRWFASNVFK